jgi:hypothetical protein
MPPVVRTLQPVIESIELEVEGIRRAGAGRLRTFVSVIAPRCCRRSSPGLRWHRAAIGSIWFDCFYFRQSAVQDGIAVLIVIWLEEFEYPRRAGCATGVFLRAVGGDQRARTVGEQFVN